MPHILPGILSLIQYKQDIENNLGEELRPERCECCGKMKPHRHGSYPRQSAGSRNNSDASLNPIKIQRYFGKDNCVSFENLKLQIPKDDHRCHYMRAKVRVHRYFSDELAIFHGPRKLADYDSKGKIKLPADEKKIPIAA